MFNERDKELLDAQRKEVDNLVRVVTWMVAGLGLAIVASIGLVLWIR